MQRIDGKTASRKFRTHLEVEEDFVRHTSQRYERNLKKWLVHLGGRRKHWSDVSKEDCVHWFAGIKQRYKPATARQILSALRKFYHWAASDGYYDGTNWWLSIKPPTVVKEVRPVLSMDQLWHVFNSAPNEDFYSIRNRAIVISMLGTGLRNAELRQVRMRDLRMDEGVIFVQHGKGRKTRKQPMDPATVESIRRWLEIRSLWAVGTDVLFVSRDGAPMSGNAIWEATKSYFRECGLEDSVYPHMLRRTGGTVMWEAGAEPRTVQEWFGHAKMDTTLDYVASADPRVRDAVNETHPFSRWMKEKHEDDDDKEVGIK